VHNHAPCVDGVGHTPHGEAHREQTWIHAERPPSSSSLMGETFPICARTLSTYAFEKSLSSSANHRRVVAFGYSGVPRVDDCVPVLLCKVQPGYPVMCFLLIIWRVPFLLRNVSKSVTGFENRDTPSLFFSVSRCVFCVWVNCSH
jgi:hypothetical protein